MNKRLAAKAEQLVHEFQSSAGRKMSQSLVILRDLFTRLEKGQWKSYLIQVDQNKAFDQINHRYLLEILEAKGIPIVFVD